MPLGKIRKTFGFGRRKGKKNTLLAGGRGQSKTKSHLDGENGLCVPKCGILATTTAAGDRHGMEGLTVGKVVVFRTWILCKKNNLKASHTRSRKVNSWYTAVLGTLSAELLSCTPAFARADR
jgi:hypothetical protein